MLRTQKDRDIRISSPLGDDVLLFYQMGGSEELSMPFRFDVHALSEDSAIDPDKILGESVTITVDLGSEGPRYFNGVVGQFRQDAAVGELASYRLTVYPWLWLLSKTTDCKVFQKKSVPDIVEAVCKENGFTDIKKSLSGTYGQREFCVQYGESDLNFISRLLESEGIYYYFEHNKDKHELVLADAIGSHQKVKGYESIPYFPLDGAPRERDHIYDWTLSREVQPGKVVLTDFDFEKPKVDLQSVSLKDRKYAQSKFEHFEYPGGYAVATDGETFARKRMDQFQSGFEFAQGSGNALAVAPGLLFELCEYPRTDQNRDYLVTAAKYTLSSDDYQAGGGGGDPFSCAFTVIPSAQTYRPKRRATVPRIFGIQTAVVVGKASEEIWTDEYGRIKVQFHWDRYGQLDENSSCWVRVSQSWAGKGWGSLHIPRIGQEVIVEFLNGDPDQPIVTGCVYNADHMPPYKLPDDSSMSGLTTRTTKEGNKKTGNELRFDDKKDKEKILVHAERDLDRVVENNESSKIGFDKKDPGDQTIEVYNSQILSVEKGDRTGEIKEGDDKLNILKGKQTTTLDKGDYSLTMSAGAGTIEAAKSIELKVGASSIKVEPSKITLSSNQIAIEGIGKIETKAAVIQTQADASLMLKGAIVKIN